MPYVCCTVVSPCASETSSPQNMAAHLEALSDRETSALAHGILLAARRSSSDRKKLMLGQSPSIVRHCSSALFPLHSMTPAASVLAPLESQGANGTPL